MELMNEAGAMLSKKNKNILMQAFEALRSLLQTDEEATQAEESGVVSQDSMKIGEQTLFSEAAIAMDGTILIRIIQAGWGSSGYYPAEVLAASAPMFKTGIQMYANHPSAEDEWSQPERKIEDIAGALTTDAYWNEADRALYARAKVFEDWQGCIEDKAEVIGVSIRAMGLSHIGKAPDGRDGNIVDQITEVLSVDFVTRAGAGGKIMLLESQKEDGMADAKEMDELRAKLVEAEQRAERLQVQGIVEKLVRESGLSAPSQKRVLGLIGSPALAEAEAHAKKMIEAEKSYLAEVAPVPTPAVQGFGASLPNDGSAAKQRLFEMYKQNMPERAAKLAAGLE